MVVEGRGEARGFQSLKGPAAYYRCPARRASSQEAMCVMVAPLVLFLVASPLSLETSLALAVCCSTAAAKAPEFG